MTFNNRFGYKKENLVIYHIFIDRFSRGKEKDEEWEPCEKPVFFGGNLRGVIDRLDYLEELGVNAIWLSPFMKTTAYHGYSLVDFYAVEPRFGDEATLKELLERAHEKKMLVLVDFVPNHVSREHPFFKDAQTNPESPYRDWFVFKRWPDQYMRFLEVDELPKINLDNEHAARHVIDAAKALLDKGIDGFRLDHVLGPTKRFWRQFRDEIAAHQPQSILIGEAWCWDSGKTASITWSQLSTVNYSGKRFAWIAGHLGYNANELAMKQYVPFFDGLMDFTANSLLRQWALGTKEFSAVTKTIERNDGTYPQSFGLAQFIDNHDMDRFLFIAKNDREKLKTVSSYQFSLPEPAIIYYGTEAGMTQKHGIADFSSHGDLVARQPMDWTKRDDELFAFYKELIKKKKKMVVEES